MREINSWRNELCWFNCHLIKASIIYVSLDMKNLNILKKFQNYREILIPLRPK